MNTNELKYITFDMWMILFLAILNPIKNIVTEYNLSDMCLYGFIIGGFGLLGFYILSYLKIYTIRKYRYLCINIDTEITHPVEIVLLLLLLPPFITMIFIPHVALLSGYVLIVMFLTGKLEYDEK